MWRAALRTVPKNKDERSLFHVLVSGGSSRRRRSRLENANRLFFVDRIRVGVLHGDGVTVFDRGTGGWRSGLLVRLLRVYRRFRRALRRQLYNHGRILQEERRSDIADNRRRFRYRLDGGDLDADGSTSRKRIGPIIFYRRSRRGNQRRQPTTRRNARLRRDRVQFPSISIYRSAFRTVAERTS